MMGKRDYDYFDAFVRAVGYSCQTAEMLREILGQYDPDTIKEKLGEVHAVEHAADSAKHDIIRELSHAFITPIEREDILLLAQEIDNVTDAIEDVLMRLYMCNVLSIREDALEFTSIIVACCDMLRQALQEFHMFRKSGTILESIVEVNRLESEGDQLYTRAVRRLHMTSHDPIELMVWREIFDQLEKCCDTCEHVANVLESIVMKNS